MAEKIPESRTPTPPVPRRPDSSPTTRFPEAFTQWKNYRGGRFSRVWIFDKNSYDVARRSPSRRACPTTPIRCGSGSRFTSAPTATASSTSSPSTPTEGGQAADRLKDFPVLSASAGAGRIVFEQAGSLHLYDLAQGKSRRLTIGVATDLPELSERFAKGTQWVRGGSVSPSGAQGRRRFPRRDRHRPGREGRSTEPHADARRPRARFGLVARRQVDRLFLRRVRRVRALHPRPGRQGRAEEIQARRRRVLRLGELVARQSQGRLCR